MEDLVQEAPQGRTVFPRGGGTQFEILFWIRRDCEQLVGATAVCAMSEKEPRNMCPGQIAGRIQLFLLQQEQWEDTRARVGGEYLTGGQIGIFQHNPGGCESDGQVCGESRAYTLAENDEMACRDMADIRQIGPCCAGIVCGQPLGGMFPLA